MIKKLVFAFLTVLLAASAFAADLSLDDLVKSLQANQLKIKDIYAETVTTIVSNMTIPGMASKGPQKMVQKGKMWSKGETKSKMEILSPTHQITINNGDKMAVINPDTGQKMVQDLSKLKATGQDRRVSGPMSLEKAKEMFNLSSSRQGNNYVITGVPKETNKFIGKMEFVIDTTRWVPSKILMYDPGGKPISQSDIEYRQIAGLWVPIKNSSVVSTPAGKMEVQMEFSNIKVNQGISDQEFAIK